MPTATKKRPQSAAHKQALRDSANARHAVAGTPAAPDHLPVVVLRLELTRARRVGVTFTDAWPVALDRALSPCRSADDRKGWADAFESTRDSWERAWRHEGNACWDVLAGAMIDVAR